MCLLCYLFIIGLKKTTFQKFNTSVSVFNTILFFQKL